MNLVPKRQVSPPLRTPCLSACFSTPIPPTIIVPTSWYVYAANSMGSWAYSQVGG